MGNYITKQYSKMMVPREPTANSMYYDAAIYNYKNKGKYYCLKFDRILDAENQIYIGIGSRDQYDDKQISLQVIRIGDYTNKYYRLLQFTESENKLKYEFEDDVTLTLKKVQDDIEMAINNDEFGRFMKKRAGNDILLELLFLKENKFISKTVDPIIIKRFKRISLASKEFDKIYDLFEESRNN